MTCCEPHCRAPHNIIDSAHLTTGASSPLTTTVKMTLEGGRFARRGLSPSLCPFPYRFPFTLNKAKMTGICREMDRVTAIDPAEQIAACGYCANSTCERPIKLRWSDECCRRCCWGAKFATGHRNGNFGLLPPHHLLAQLSHSLIMNTSNDVIWWRWQSVVCKDPQSMSFGSRRGKNVGISFRNFM